MTELEIDAFLEVCRQKNISYAAARLYISQSALSIRLKTLEKEAGCPLLHRQKGNRQVTLTSEGSAFYDLALQYKELIRAMRSVGNPNTGTKLRIGCINSIGTHFLPLVCERFLQRSPSVQVEFQSTITWDACRKLERGDIDLDFSAKNVQTEQILSTPLFSEKMVFICSALSDYPETVELDMLRVEDERFSRWSAEHVLWHQNTFGPDSTPPACMGFMGRMEFFTPGSRLWAIVPHSLVMNQDMPHIRQCKMDFEVPDRTIYALSSRRNQENINISRFLDCFRESFLEMQISGKLL